MTIRTALLGLAIAVAACDQSPTAPRPSSRADRVVRTGPSLALTPSVATLAVGQTVLLTASGVNQSGHPVNNPGVTFTVDNAVVALDPSAKRPTVTVTARASGTANVLATWVIDSLATDCPIGVAPPCYHYFTATATSVITVP